MKRLCRSSCVRRCCIGLVVLLTQQPGKAQASAAQRAAVLQELLHHRRLSGRKCRSVESGWRLRHWRHSFQRRARQRRAAPMPTSWRAFLLLGDDHAGAEPSVSRRRAFPRITTSAASRSSSGPTKLLAKETSPCWTGGSGDVFAMRAYRADVLRFLHVPTNADGTPAGKRLINDVDYAAAAAADASIVSVESAAARGVWQSCAVSRPVPAWS